MRIYFFKISLQTVKPIFVVSNLNSKFASQKTDGNILGFSSKKRYLLHNKIIKLTSQFSVVQHKIDNKKKYIISKPFTTYLSLSLSSPLLLFKVTACKVSKCCVTSSTQRQFTNSWRCKEALQWGHCDLCSVNQRLIQT